MEKVIKLKPCVKSYLWGGSFFQKYGKSDLEIVSELWELSVRDEFSSIVASGENKGKRLNEVLTKDDLGPKALKYKYFPLLIKLIDAREKLSVQVHPSDEYALKKENSFGKTEMWHIIDADEGSGIYLGFDKDYDKKEIEERLNNGTILECLNFFKVKPGDTFMINPGTIHAIGGGVRLIEIQQNSDLTYRLYDYSRIDKDGKCRELHIQKALEVINYRKYEPVPSSKDYLVESSYFKVKRIEFSGEVYINANEGSFISFTFISGNGKVDDIDYQTFDTFFLPYNKKCHIKGKGVIILTTL